jgi:large subunit ribosomal protein L4
MRVNKKMRKGALRSALTDALASGKLAVVTEITFDEPKTKRAAELLSALELSGNVLVLLARPTDDGAAEKSFRNLTDVKVAYAGGPGTYDVLWADRVLLTGDALDALEGKGSAPEAEKGSAPEAGEAS